MYQTLTLLSKNRKRVKTNFGRIGSWYSQPLLYAVFLSEISRIATDNWPFFWNLSSNLHSSLILSYVNLLYVSLFFLSLSLAYNEGHLYV